MSEKTKEIASNIIDSLVMSEEGRISIGPTFKLAAQDALKITDDGEKLQLSRELGRLAQMLTEEHQAKETAALIQRLANQVKPKGQSAVRGPSAAQKTVGLQMLGAARERIATFRKGLRPLPAKTSGAGFQSAPPKKTPPPEPAE